ncbi:hypothetical protein C9374_009629 [Naegleria lovaniensis]|uniref:Vesicle tethering protein Uso1/P115-like head domain-containing protein n=1 Tax=Naegleria lovaniensis TaxID=51637 RepID=A0AA88KRA0_NAELO|nr:uncharacterized protein C9374_009629 [Naegleria lovaniensis]KAG2393052.1 hypothetical protein C9374_009629 [Naegleria lovaniensis]
MASWIFQNLLTPADLQDDDDGEEHQTPHLSDHNSTRVTSTPSHTSSNNNTIMTTTTRVEDHVDIVQVKPILSSSRSPASIDVSVSDLLHRIETSSLHDDRIEAMENLIELSSQDMNSQNSRFNHHKEFKEIFPKLINHVNQNESETTTRQYLTIICNLAQLENHGPIYLDLIINNNNYLSILISLLNENNSYLRYQTIQLLNILLQYNPLVIQDAILKEATIPLILSLLNEYGVLRNEGILFLRNLTREINQLMVHSPSEQEHNMAIGNELKKIIVFEGAFEKLFGIILQEGGNQGGVLVLDCLYIILYLLKDNELNRKQFLMLQNGGMTFLYPLLVIPEFKNHSLSGMKTNMSSLTTNTLTNSESSYGFLKSVAGVAMNLMSGNDQSLYQQDSQHSNFSSHLNGDDHFSISNPMYPMLLNEQVTKQNLKQISSNEKQLEIISIVLDILLELMKSTKEPVKDIITHHHRGGTRNVNSTQSILIPILKLSFDYIFTSMVGGHDSNTSPQQQLSNMMNLIPPLIRTIMYDINMKSIFLLGHLTFNNRSAQEVLESYFFQYGNTLSIPSQLLMSNGIQNVLTTNSSGNGLIHSLMIEESAIIRLCKLVLYDSDEYRRQLAFSTLKRFLYNNKEGQLIIASTVKAPNLIASSSEECMLCGIVLSDALFSLNKPKFHPLESVHAISILSIIIRQNTKCKDILLEIPYESGGGGGNICSSGSSSSSGDLNNNNNNMTTISTKRILPTHSKSFFTCLINLVVYAIQSRVQDFYTCALLRLLCEWINGSSQSARKFIEHSRSTLLFFSEVIASSHGTSPLIQALCCMLLGLVCMEYEDPSSTVVVVATSSSVITSSVVATTTSSSSVTSSTTTSNHDESGNDSFHHPIPVGRITKNSVVDLVLRRVGIQRMKEKFDILRQHNVMIGALNQPKFNYESLQISDTTPIQVLPIDLEFATFASSAIHNILTFFSQNEINSSQENILLKDLEKHNQKLQQEEKERLIREKNQEIEKRELIEEQYKNQISKLEHEIQTLKMEKDTTIHEINSTNETYQNQLRNFSNENQKLKTRITELSERLNTLQDEKNTLSELNQQMESNQLQTQQRISEYKAHLEQTQLQLKSLQEKFDSELHEKEFKNNLQQEQLNKLQLQLKQKEDEIEHMTREFEDKLNQLKKQESETIQLNFSNQLAMKDSQINTLYSENDSLKHYISQLTTNIQQVEEKMKHVYQEKESLSLKHQDHSNRLQQELKQKQDEIQNLLKANESFQQTIQLLQNDLMNLKNQSIQKDSTVQALRQENEGLKQNISQMNLNHQQLLQQQAALQESLKKTQSIISEKEKRIEELDKDNEDMIDIIEKLEEKLALQDANK